MKKTIILFGLILFVLRPGSSQDGLYAGNADASYFVARELAFAGHHISARDTLKQILKRYPDYADVRSLLAKTYSWDAQYDEARSHLNKITSVDRQNKEAWIAAVKNEIYAKNLNIALGLTNKALIYLPNDEELTTLKTRLKEELLASYNNASGPLNTAEKDTLEMKGFNNQMALYNAFDVFDVVYDPMIYSGIEYTRLTEAGKLIPRINYANRFDIHGLQYEMDFYPELSKMFYGYLNYGYSDSEIFPTHRVGVELYSNLPKSKEASLGIRYLNFLEQQTTIYTGSFGLYKGNYYASLRAYVTPSAESSTGVSGQLTGRKYLASRDQYIGLILSMGFIPELKQLSANNTLLAETLLFIDSQQLQLEYQFTGKSLSNLFKAHLGLTHQELVFEPGRYFWAVTAGLKYHVRF